MDFLSRVIKRIKRDFFKWRYLLVARKVLNTKPLQKGNLPFLLLSMVQKSDVVSYLVAVKSFALNANPQKVVVVCDPSMEPNDREILRKHIPHIDLRDASEFADSRVPRGGTWERLLAISTYVEDHYVVQLDSDTVTVRAIPEIIDAIKNSTGFVLGESANQKILTFAEANKLSQRFAGPNNHIQDQAELKMVELPDSFARKYVRGCSGFTGFPPTLTMRHKLIEYSMEMERLVGERWKKWGTEQVTSNYLVANSCDVKILPFPKYATPDKEKHETVFLHFIGYTRFVNKKYEKISKKIINLFDSVVN